MSFASLPMYDLPEIRPAADDFWRGLARAFRAEGLDDVPDGLTRPDDLHAAWRSPDLFLSQICGYPLITAYAGLLRMVATPVYGAPGCDGPCYRSALVVRRDYPAKELADLRGGKVAINSRDSQSGYNALRHLVAPLAGGRPFFGSLLESGGHAASLAAVVERRADVAAIDCITLALLARHRPQLGAAVRIMAHTAAAPGLPIVVPATVSTERLQRLRAGLAAALADPELAPARDALLLRGAEILPEDAYQAIGTMEAEACALGYAELP